MFIVDARCDTCMSVFELDVDFYDYMAWKGGTFVQDAMPYLTADERELLISNTCGDCWDNMFVVFA